MKELFDHLDSIFGERSRHLFSSLTERVVFLSYAAQGLEGALRKEKVPDLETRLASVFARLACVVAGTESGASGFVMAMVQKYPRKCVYCLHSTCVCPMIGRSDVQAVELSMEQVHWSLSDWQEHLHRVYGERNACLPHDEVLRLFAEIAEVGILCIGAPEGEEEMLQAEVADALAWLLAIASRFEIPLERALHQTYGAGCPLCRAFICVCPLETVRAHTVQMPNTDLVRSV